MKFLIGLAITPLMFIMLILVILNKDLGYRFGLKQRNRNKTKNDYEGKK
jgi:hypothetical protein